jgi:hypothetical protein
MIKLIYSSAFDALTDVGMRIIEDPAQLTKQASTIFGCDYADLAPDKDHVGIHLTAVGATERYGFNRNGDGFPKQACVDYHDTFVKYGHVYRHHRNKDPLKALGNIKASAYSDEMDRIELFIHAHKDKARDELNRLEKEGEIPFSMACKVAFDRCSICNRKRKNGKDPNQCEHVATKLGQYLDNGQMVGTENDEPYYFDISFVGRPAERIAWNLKVASGEFVDSIKLAEQSGLWVPDHIAVESASGLSKMAHLRTIADFENRYTKWASQHPATHQDRYFWELRKAASCPDDQTIEELRCYEPADVWAGLAKAGVVLSAPAFYKYAFGTDYGEAKDFIAEVIQRTHTICSDVVKAGECQQVCNDTTFDVNPQRCGVPAPLLRKVAMSTLIGTPAEERVIQQTIARENVKIAVDLSSEIEFNTNQGLVAVAVKYAAYKVAAAEAILKSHDTDRDTVLAVMAAQNKIER